MKKLLIIIGLTLTLVGCSEKVNEAHEAFLNDAGWTIESFGEEEAYIIEVPEDLMDKYHTAKIHFLDGYNGKDVETTQYILKESEKDGENLIIMIYEVEGEIIGGIGRLPSWTPGIFNALDKEKLIDLGVLE